MPVHHFDLTRIPATPWKNGGGTTREIVCYPPGGNVAGFDWRVSVASITSSGPFSPFPGIDRQIMLLDGDGVHLRGEDINHKLDTPFLPFAFSGDAALDCAMLGGASTDFNVMTRRGYWQADLHIARAEETVVASTGLLMVLDGAWQMNEETCARGQGAWWDDATVWKCKPVSPNAVLALLTLMKMS